MSVYARIGTFCQDDFGYATYVSLLFQFISEKQMELMTSNGGKGLDKYYQENLPKGLTQIDELEIIDRLLCPTADEKFICVTEENLE